jgi:zona occludens toxin
MIRLTTGTPGAGKTIYEVLNCFNTEKSNTRNLLLNTKIFDSNNKLLIEKDLLSEFSFLEYDVGQGVALKQEILHFDSNYFDCFKTSERIEEYFFKSIHYNEIIKRINEDHSLTLNLLKPVRTIYTNIAGLKIDNIRPLPVDYDWRKLPDGSIVVYDEIQNIPIFSSESRNVDPILKDLTIHRHRGFDIVGITQFPNLVHNNFRALVGDHKHLVNSFKLKSSTLYTWSICKTDPNALRNKLTAEIKETFRFPKNLYKFYKSSTAHTHKAQLPWRFIFIITFVLAVCISLFSWTMSDNKNIASQIVTGGNSNEKSIKSTNNSKQSDNIKNDQASSEVTEPIDSNKDDNFATSDNTDSDDIPIYDASKPYDYVPHVSPVVVNNRIFSGCFCSKKECFATDQQGIRLKDFPASACKNIIDDSKNRPFDYFNSRPNEQAQNVNYSESNRNSPSSIDLNLQKEIPDHSIDRASVYEAN